MKKTAKFIVKIIDHMVNLTALLLVLMTMFLSCYMLWDSNQVYQAADAKNYEAYIPTEKHTKSFEELQKINPDIIGWIRVNETNINYPLLQAEDDDTYMNTDAEGRYSLSGAIFLHCANKPDFSDFNNIIYGHHMEKHMMFGDVGLFTEKKYFDEHPYGNLFFDGKDHGIEFYALLQADAYNEKIFSVCADTSEARQAYLQEIEANALHRRNLKITENDHLVLLITCTSEMTNGRNILVGRLTDQVYPEKEYFDEHPYGNLFFDGKDHGIEFYALIQADAYNETLFSVCADTSETRQAYLQEIEANAIYRRNIKITENDHLVLLTTCTSEMTNGRNILVGKLTDQVYPEKEKVKNMGTGIDELKEKLNQVPVIFWLILLIIVLLLIDRILGKRRKKKYENL